MYNAKHRGEAPTHQENNRNKKDKGSNNNNKNNKTKPPTSVCVANGEEQLS